ncbi:tyrosine-type recombinase/integrase [Novosphingobium sp. BL-52-GroH]|uniref:tyrosine-type recombinase/integrase n=1 Tax=Novosphingobium sp. BL-52-GroH TaxID=3349877 RepID=UPI00384B48B0
MPATILATERGTAWTESGFRASWRKACIKSGASGVTFHDLRGTAVTRLAVAGATVPEIAAITGHSLKEVGTILDTHYMHRDPALAEAAIRKLEERAVSPNQTPNHVARFNSLFGKNAEKQVVAEEGLEPPTRGL